MNLLRPRVIPCLQVANGELIKTRRFKDPTYLGDPINAVKLFNDLDCDELIVADIRATVENREPDYAFIEEFASEAFMPLTYGGGVTSVDQIRRILSIGIEKVVIGAAAPDGKLIAEASAIFGSQSVVASVDVKKSLLGRREVWIRSGTRNMHVDPLTYAKQMEQHGAGELFVQSVDLEGAQSGFDISMMQEVSAAIRVPIIACGGARTLKDIDALFQATAVAAAAAGTMFVFHGKHKAPLISYPRPEEIAALRHTRN
jgi:cyclase